MELDETQISCFRSGAESKPGFFPRNLAALFWPSSNTGTTCHGIHVLRKSFSQSIRVTAQLVSPIEKASPEQKPLLTVLIGRARTSDQDRTGIACFDELNR